MASSKAMLVAKADLKMALQVKYVKYGLIGMGAFGPILSILLVLFMAAAMPPGPDYDIIMGFFKPMVGTLLAMFSIIPATMIAANALVGEREQNTMEPLLCTPLTDRQLLLGKTLSSFIPSMILLVVGTFVVMIVTNIGFKILGKPLTLIPDVAGLFLIFAAGPLTILAAVSVNIIVSGKVKRVYEAYQTSAMIILVFMIPIFAPLIGMIRDTPNLSLVIFADLVTFLISAVLVVVTWAIALKRFNRDTMVSRR
jgi:ABC-type Na+ efflux pump permease subunit